MKMHGVIQLVQKNWHHKYYRICTEEESKKILADREDSEIDQPEYQPEVLERISELTRSNSQKDRRIGSLLQQCMKKCQITMDDYAAIGEAAKWPTDMQLASQMGLVERITPQRYTILRELNTGPFCLSKRQSRIITEMYESFGDEVFSSEMVVATLDYSRTHVSAYLHQFALLRILDCRKEDVYLYQFLITPEEHPECFESVA